MAFRPAVHVPLILAGLGAVFLVPGLLLSFSHESERAAARGAALATVTAKTLEAQVLFGGDQAAYMANLRGDVLAERILSGVFLGVGVLLLLIAGLLRREEPRSSRR
jgi:hypothetical protein